MMTIDAHLQNHLKNFNMRLEYLLPFFINNDNTSLTSFPCMNERITPSSSFVISYYFGQIYIGKGSKFFGFVTCCPRKINKYKTLPYRHGRAGCALT